MVDWSTPFDESMLGGPVIIHCPEESNADDLMVILGRHGIMWQGTHERPTSGSGWEVHREQTCYWVFSGILSYGTLRGASSRADDLYAQYTKCTFCPGYDLPDFETSGEASLF